MQNANAKFHKIGSEQYSGEAENVYILYSKFTHDNMYQFLSKSVIFYRASICEGGFGSRNSVCLSVCPSVRLSATRVDCDKTK